MSDRLTRSNLEDRVASLNGRMAARGSIYHYELEGRNGYTAIDRYADMDGRNACMSTVRCGTKNEVGEFLHAMMVALDDASVTS